MTTPLELGTYGFGNAVYPLATLTSGQTVLSQADPTLAGMLGFYSAVLGLQLGALWTQAATAAGLTPAQYAAPVAYVTPLDPSRHFEEESTVYPLLAIYRTSEKYGRHTEGYTHVTGTMGIDYALPPLTTAQAEQLVPFLQAASRVLYQSTEVGSHPEYNSGAFVWWDLQVESIYLTEASFGLLQGTGNLAFPCAHLSLTLSERQMRVAGDYPTLVDVDVDQQLDPADGEPVVDQVIEWLAGTSGS